jgi:hypothetical protein
MPFMLRTPPDPFPDSRLSPLTPRRALRVGVNEHPPGSA